MPKRTTTWLAVLVMALAATGAGAALASSGSGASDGSTGRVIAGQDDREVGGEAESAEDTAEGPDVPITGPDLDAASAAALAYLGEGRVTATEVGDEESYYEVEVTLDDGRQVDVQLDESFIVVGLG